MFLVALDDLMTRLSRLGKTIAELEGGRVDEVDDWMMSVYTDSLLLVEHEDAVRRACALMRARLLQAEAHAGQLERDVAHGAIRVLDLLKEIGPASSFTLTNRLGLVHAEGVHCLLLLRRKGFVAQSESKWVTLWPEAFTPHP